MSNAELERAATAPSRWIALSSRNHDGFLPSCTTRVPKDLASLTFETMGYWGSGDFIYPYVVPGGRYLVISSQRRLAVWDLRYVSDGDMSSDRKPTTFWTTMVKDVDGFLVHPTPDGLGIRILLYSWKYVHKPRPITYKQSHFIV